MKEKLKEEKESWVWVKKRSGLQCGLEQPQCAGIQELGGGQGGGGWERN